MSFDSTPPPAPESPAPQAPAAAQTAPEPEAQKKPLLQRWWFWAIVAVVLIAIFVPKGGGSDASDTAPADAASAPAADEATDDGAASADEPAAEEPADEPATTPLGTPASTGDLELTVTGVETGVAQVGEEFGGTLLGERAQGQFVLVHLTVANTGDGPTSFASFNAKLLDAGGREFGANDAAALYIEGNSLYEEINPGNTLQGVLVFDIPADAAPAALEYDGGFLAQPAVFALQ